MPKKPLSNLPEWVQKLMDEMMKPPHFMDHSKKNSLPGRTAEVPYSEMQHRSEGRGTTASSAVRLATPTMFRAQSSTATLTPRVAPSTVVSTIPPAVLNQYPWTIERKENYGDVLRIYTGEHSYALKPSHVTPQRVRFIHRALQHARKQGFHKFSPLATTKQKAVVVHRNGQTYYATKWIEGVHTQFNSTEHLGQTAYTLAQFNAATEGFSQKGYNPNDVYNLFALYNERLHDLRELFNMAERRRQSDEFDALFLQMKDELLADAQQCVQLLQQRETHEFLESERRRGGIAHLDVIPGNCIYDGAHQVNIIDFDLSTFAPRSLDLAHLLRRALEATNYAGHAAYVCFLHFNAVRPMPRAEYQVVESLLRFPYRAWRIAHTRYRFFNDSQQLLDLEQYARQAPRRQEFLREYAQQVADLTVQQ